MSWYTFSATENGVYGDNAPLLSEDAYSGFQTSFLPSGLKVCPTSAIESSSSSYRYYLTSSSLFTKSISGVIDGTTFTSVLYESSGNHQIAQLNSYVTYPHTFSLRMNPALVGSGYVPYGWLVSTTGPNPHTYTNATFHAGEEIEVTLYGSSKRRCAVIPVLREKQEVTITYDGNGGTVTPTSETVTSGDSVTLPTPTLANATFLGWYSGTTKIGDAGDSYTATATITLTAKWIRIDSSGSFIFTAYATHTPTSMNIGEWRIESSDVDGEDTLYWTITTPFVQTENNMTWNFVSFTFRAVGVGGSTEFTVRQPSGSWTTAGSGYRYISVPPDGTVWCRGIYGDNLVCNPITGYLICNSNGSLAYGNQIISF